MEQYTRQQAIKHFGITEENYNKRYRAFKESFIYGTEDLLYFDGDGGCLWCKFSEMFEDEGLAMGNVDCRYCDISFYGLLRIQDFFEDLAKRYNDELMDEDF